jgi:hypothetical protein
LPRSFTSDCTAGVAVCVIGTFILELHPPSIAALPRETTSPKPQPEKVRKEIVAIIRILSKTNQGTASVARKDQ